MATNNTGRDRGTWSTRSAFVLAAIGSAVGLGNLWGFPYKVYTYGGGAFLVPYFLAMAVMGIPLLIMEFSVGHWAQHAAPGAFAKIAGRYRFIGWWLVALAFVIITYYTVILSYCVIYLVESIHSMAGAQLPWGGGTEAAGKHFFADFLKYETGFALKGVRMPILIGMLVSWGLIYACLFRGVKWISRVVLFTVPLPWIMLVILAVRGLTLDGAVTGLQYYLEPHWEKLAEADTWRFAFGQVFFSMSLGFAVMLSYASFLHRKSDINNNALIIGLSDLGTSFLAGIAVFSTLGAMALVDNKAVESVVAGGPGLAFVTFPYALSTLPAGQAFFSLVFFVALLTLGIDSAFSIVEACLAAVCDSKPQWPRSIVLPSICAVGAAIGVLYCCGGGGLNWLGFVDDLINGPFGILVVALAECLIIGWACKGKFIQKMRQHANERSDWKLYGWWDITVKYIAPIFLFVLLAWSVADFIYAKKIPQLIGSGVFLLIPLSFWLFSSREDAEAAHSEEDDGLAGRLVLFVPLTSTLIGAGIGIVRLLLKKSVSAATVTEKASGFVEKELGITAYIVLTIALTVIVGGLVWCFWKAIQAAGRQDPQIDDS